MVSLHVRVTPRYTLFSSRLSLSAMPAPNQGVPLSRLRVELRDYDTGRLLPARVYLRDSSGKVWTPTEALRTRRAQRITSAPLETLSIAA
jgi:hypothetical protein